MAFDPDIDDTSLEELEWRVGTHYGIHIYAERPLKAGGTVSYPVGTAMDPGLANRIVEDHNEGLTHTCV